MINTIYSQKNRFIVLSLIGRIGRGYNAAAYFLSRIKKEHKIYEEIVPFKDKIDLIQKGKN